MRYLNINSSSINNDGASIYLISATQNNNAIITKVKTRTSVIIQPAMRSDIINVLITKNNNNNLILVGSGTIILNNLDENSDTRIDISSPVDGNLQRITIPYSGTIHSLIDERFYSAEMTLEIHQTLNVSITNKPLYKIASPQIIKTHDNTVDKSILTFLLSPFQNPRTYIYDRYTKLILLESSWNKRSPKERPINLTPYDNNQIVSPVDGRLRIVKGGFIIRVMPQDSKQVIIPYGADFESLSVNSRGTQRDNPSDYPTVAIYKFQTEFFMSKDVFERDYWSVITGAPNYSNGGVGMGTRNWPELMPPQAEAPPLIYHIIVKSSTGSKKIITQHPKGTMDTGAPLCTLPDDGGFVKVVFNKDVEFSDDIIETPFECKINRGDGIGTLQ